MAEFSALSGVLS